MVPVKCGTLMTLVEEANSVQSKLGGTALQLMALIMVIYQMQKNLGSS